ncbi:MAG: hypothetical protein ACLR2C_03175 [Parasutterella excrementihominis]
MKRITVRCPLVLNVGSQQFEFKPAQSYEVEDAVAAHPYLQAHLATFIDITPPAKEKPVEAEEKVEEPTEEKAAPEVKENPAPKKNAKKTTNVKEAENVEPASDA